MTTVVGLDPSISGAGIAVIRTADPRIAMYGNVDAYTQVITSRGRASDTMPQQAARLLAMRNAVMDRVPRDADLVMIEGLALGKTNPGTDRLAHLFWLLVSALGQVVPNAHITRVAIPTLKKAVTDNGKADKRAVQAGVTRWWPGVAMRDDNAADALALASLGAVHMRVPVPFPIQEHTRLALAKLDLPDRPAR